MVRLPDSDRLDLRLARNELAAPEVDRLARFLAAFHAKARSDPETSRFGEREAIERNLRENFEQTRTLLPEYLSPSSAREIEDRQLAFLADHEELFRSRIDGYRIRDGHGDLRLEQIYLDDATSPLILDCIEFNDRFRYGDICADLAFLSMDFRYHGRADLAERLLATYARESSDFDLYGLVDFYEGYRAFVRGKVAGFLEQDAGAPELVRRRARGQAERLFLLALAKCRAPKSPSQLLAVGGRVASGKSTIADWLGLQLSAPVIDTDRTRKALLGVPATRSLSAPLCQGAYDPAVTQRVYSEIVRRAEIVLASNRSVILDATFHSSWLRQRIRALAQAHGVPFHFIECRASDAACRERLRARENQFSVSDARLDVYEQFSSSFEPVREFSEGEHIVLDTTSSLEQCANELQTRLGLSRDKRPRAAGQE